jgi:hypothetical protein
MKDRTTGDGWVKSVGWRKSKFISVRRRAGKKGLSDIEIRRRETN